MIRIGLEHILDQLSRFAVDTPSLFRERQCLRVFDSQVVVVRHQFPRFFQRIAGFCELAHRLVGTAEQGPAFGVVRIFLELGDQSGNGLIHVDAVFFRRLRSRRNHAGRIERSRFALDLIEQDRTERHKQGDEQGGQNSRPSCA